MAQDDELYFNPMLYSLKKSDYWMDKKTIKGYIHSLGILIIAKALRVMQF
jgi:hypothetical protein